VRGLDPTLRMKLAVPNGGVDEETIPVVDWKTQTFIEFFTAKLQAPQEPAVQTA
jgi:hypothetical protein